MGRVGLSFTRETARGDDHMLVQGPQGGKGTPSGFTPPQEGEDPKVSQPADKPTEPAKLTAWQRFKLWLNS